MTDSQATADPRTTIAPPGLREAGVTIAITLFAVAAALVLVAVIGEVHLLKPGDGEKGDLAPVINTLENAKGPGNALLGSAAGLGLLGGGAMLSCGMQSGIRMMTMSGCAGGGVLLGNGVIA